MIDGVRGKQLEGTSSHEGIVLYGPLDCEPCREAEAFLQAQSIPYMHVILEWQKPDVRQALKKLFYGEYGARPIYPVLEYCGTYYFGFSKERWAEILKVESAPE